MDEKNFLCPPSALRARTFWSLNGELEAGELKRQIRILRRMGFGGAYLHSRSGLKTEYLSDEWFSLMSVCADELGALGMQAWLYDEDRYPSGVAGGYVTRDPALRGKYLTVRVLSSRDYREEEGDVAAFYTEWEGERLLSYRPYGGEEGTVAVFSVHTRPCEDVYNGYAYFDAMNGAATAEFLRLTHEGYARAMGERLATSFKGIFTDEPNRGAIFNGFAHVGERTEARVPYTEALFSAYREQWGESLEKVLPSLFFRGGEECFSRTAWRYTETVTRLFLENYAEPYAKWCDAHGLVFTGHILHEDNLSAMTTLCGSPMRFYEKMSLPGMDNLTAMSTCLAVPVMVASVARQTGKRGVMSEMYAAIGWQADFATYKRVGDWQAMLGVTDRCTHLSMYSMAGAAKRDFPASILHQAVWWKDYALVEDYFARLNYFLSQGEQEIQALVIHPVESAWGMGRAGGYRNHFTPVDGEYLALEETYWRIANELTLGGVAYDFGDEEMMSRLSFVEETADGARLAVGRQRYPAVLLAGNVTLRSSTYALLQKFLAAGGRVLVAGGYPRFADGEPFDGRAALAGAEETEGNVAAYFRPPFGCTGGAAYTRFARGKEEEYFAVVSAEETEKTFTLTFGGSRFLEKWDVRTGKHAPLGGKTDGRQTTATLTLAAGEECCLRLTEGVPVPVPRRREQIAVPLPAEAEYILKEPNVLVLDFPLVEGAGMREEREILSADIALRKRLGFALRTPEAIQPWFRKKYLPENRTSARISLTYRFWTEELPSSLSLAWEPVKGARLSFNGVKIGGRRKGYFRDKCLPVYPLPVELLRVGENKITLEFTMREDTQLEAMYLLGPFGVRVEGRRATIVPLPPLLRVGDVVPQGLPFYAGEIEYAFPLPEGRYEVTLPEIGGALARVGGRKLPFRPYRAKFVSKGTLRVAVTLTQKNTFGPLHYAAPVSLGASEEFLDPAPAFRSDDYVLIKQGLLAAPVVKKGGGR